jgi:hypothetical protein
MGIAAPGMIRMPHRRLPVHAPQDVNQARVAFGGLRNDGCEQNPPLSNAGLGADHPGTDIAQEGL